MKYFYAFFICLFAFSHLVPQEIKKPRVSIITSVFDPQDLFVEGFLKDITRQTIFDQCELLLICPPAGGNSESIIKKYCQQYPNIKHIKLRRDPGLYAVWNIGVKAAKADFVTNANIDDRRNPRCLEEHAKALEQNPSITLVYSPFYYTYTPNAVFEKPHSKGTIDVPEFARKLMGSCFAGPMPMWRKEIHEAAGYFREDFISSGDYEMWNRMVSVGASFKRVGIISGVYYVNPKGISTDPDTAKSERRQQEDRIVAELYSHLWK